MAITTCAECGADTDDLGRCPHCDDLDFAAAAPPPLAVVARRPAAPALLISVGDSSQVLPAGHEIFLGRSPRSTLREQFAVYSNVSGDHATVWREGGRLFVIHSGRNGTWRGDTALEPCKPYDFPLPVTLRFAANCYVHFAAATVDEPDPGSAP